MKRGIQVLLALSLVFMMSTTAFAGFGLPGILSGAGDDNSSSNQQESVDADGLTNTANQMIVKYTLSTVAFASAFADTLQAYGLDDQAAKVLAARDAFQDNSTQEHYKDLGRVVSDGMKPLENVVKNKQIDADQAQTIMDQAALKSKAAGLINLSLIPDAVNLLKDTSSGLQSLSKNPVANKDGIQKLKSTLAVVQYMNAAMPEQEKYHKEYNTIIDQIAQKYGATAPSDDQVKEAADNLVQN